MGVWEPEGPCLQPGGQPGHVGVSSLCLSLCICKMDLPPPPSLADEDQERRGESDVHLSHGWTRMCCPAQAGPCGGLAGISPPSSSCRKQADAAGASLVPALLTAAPVISRKISVLLFCLSLALHCSVSGPKKDKKKKNDHAGTPASGRRRTSRFPKNETR